MLSLPMSPEVPQVGLGASVQPCASVQPRPEPEVDLDVMHHAEDLSDDSDRLAANPDAERFRG